MSEDPQAKRLYKFEDDFMKAALMGRCSRKTLQRYADKACRRWRVPPVKVVFAKDVYWYGQYFDDEQMVKLYDAPKRKRRGHGRNVHVLLHEVAHHIDGHLWDSQEHHGPVFAAIAMDLYDHYGVLPSHVFRRLAKEHGVKVAHLHRRKH